MWKFVLEILVMFLASMCYFPFEFTFLPGLNTKMMIAAVGLAVLLLLFLKRRKVEMPWPLIVVLLFSAFVSLVGLFSITYNGTNDTAYSGYFTSACVWLSASFVVCMAIKGLHGKLSMPLLIRYLVAVCVFQCVMALVIDGNEAVRRVVDTFVAQGQEMLKYMGRLYGIGASLDVAGSRFAAALIMLAFLIRAEKDEGDYWRIALYFTCFLVILVVGSMIARTTYVGGILALGAVVLRKDLLGGRMKQSTVSVFGVMLGITTLLTIVAVVLYNNNESFHEYLRFAFEGFFNLVENGEYSVASTNKLETMYVWPDNFKTWVIGDGYFSNPRGDINYIGDTTTEGFYMGTDVGYCRFIFYFGIIGLVAISLVMIATAIQSAKIQMDWRTMAFLVLVANFVVWFKVSTDLFPALSLMLCTGMIYEAGKRREEQ